MRKLALAILLQVLYSCAGGAAAPLAKKALTGSWRGDMVGDANFHMWADFSTMEGIVGHDSNALISDGLTFTIGAYDGSFTFTVTWEQTMMGGTWFFTDSNGARSSYGTWTAWKVKHVAFVDLSTGEVVWAEMSQGGKYAPPLPY